LKKPHTHKSDDYITRGWVSGEARYTRVEKKLAKEGAMHLSYLNTVFRYA
jgi:hypothetical protein